MSIEFEVQDTRVPITVTQIDHNSAKHFVAELAEGLARYEETPRPAPGRATTAMIVDLRDVTFLDSSGIRALIDADRKALQFGGRVVITNATGIVRRCLEVTGVYERMAHPADRHRA